MMKTKCSIFASPSAFEMAALCSVLASLLGGRLQAVAKNKAIEATNTAANIANTARFGTQTLAGANPPHQDHDSFRMVHSALREDHSAQRAGCNIAMNRPRLDEDHVRVEGGSPQTSVAVWLGKKGKWRCAARRNSRASCSTYFRFGDYDTPASPIARQALEYRVQLRRRRV